MTLGDKIFVMDTFLLQAAIDRDIDKIMGLCLPDDCRAERLAFPAIVVKSFRYSNHLNFLSK